MMICGIVTSVTPMKECRVIALDDACNSVQDVALLHLMTHAIRCKNTGVTYMMILHIVISTCIHVKRREVGLETEPEPTMESRELVAAKLGSMTEADPKNVDTLASLVVSLLGFDQNVDFTSHTWTDSNHKAFLDGEWVWVPFLFFSFLF